MKALLISASPHKEKSNTFLLAQEVVRGLTEAGIQTEVIHLSDMQISFCRHCEECHKKILASAPLEFLTGFTQYIENSNHIKFRVL